MSRRYKTGIDRLESVRLPARVDDYVDADNPVRAIDAYIELLDLTALGFDRTAPNRTAAGQPAFAPATLLKLYLYGYINRLRSSRVLARECRRNLEVIWLLQGLRPGYKTIADFRQRNAQAVRRVHVDFIALCKKLTLLGGERVAVDGSHFNGNVSDKSFRTAKRLQQTIDQLAQQIDAWLSAMDDADRQEGDEAPARDRALAAPLQRLQALKAAKEAMLQTLHASGETQCSTTDADARLLNKGGQKTAGYNVQIVTDSRHKLIVADAVVQDSNDLQQLHPMLSQAKAALGVEQLQGFGDKGYFNTAQLAQCAAENIVVYVPEPEKSGRQRQAGRFTREAFTYVAEADVYRCPHGQCLKRSGPPKQQNGSWIQRYSGSETHCRPCPLRPQCLSAKSDCREIWRNEHEAVLEAHRQRMASNPSAMRQRSAWVEHPFGTLKCRAGWNHFLLRGLAKVRGEWSLMALAYNFTRVLNLLGLRPFKAYCTQKAAACGG